MSNVAVAEVKNPSNSAASQPAPMEVLIVGKVARVRRYEGTFYTVIVCPAVDLYSRPQTVEIRSKARFSDPDDTVKVTARLGGFEGRQYRVTDKDTGESRMLVPVNQTLDLVE